MGAAIVWLARNGRSGWRLRQRRAVRAVAILGLTGKL
jgi:hypothetical protein